MATVQELITLGEKMGLKDKDLQSFVTEQQKVAREDRERERQDREKERERDRQLQMQMEDAKAKERQQKLQVEDARAKVEWENNKAQFELEKGKQQLEEKRLQLEAQKLQQLIDGNTSADNNSGGTSGGKIKGPKMAPFDERDDMDSYLFRFERYAEMQGWKNDDWATYLSALLKGKALDVYARLTPEESQNYGKLKDALLRRYQLTEDGFKCRFYTAKPEIGESPQQFITRLANYLVRWVELAEVEKTYDGICSLVVREQYLSTCGKDLELFLRERAETDLTELAKLAEQYEDAHKSGIARKGVAQQKGWKTNVEGGKPDSSKSLGQQERGHSAKKCFVCDKVGHLAKNCFKRVQAGAMVQRFASPRQFPSRGGGNFTQRSNSGGGGWGSNSGTMGRQPAGTSNAAYIYCKAHGRQQCMDCNSITPVAEKHTCNALLAPEVRLECGCKLPVVADACDTLRSGRTNMPVAKGWMGEKEVTVLRDTGCSAVVVRSELVTERQLTGKSTLCILIDGTARRVPTARIDVDTPYYKGSVEALCMRKPIYDLILGNISGVLDKPELAVAGREVIEDSMEVHNDGHTAELQAVETRAQTKKDKVDKLLKVPGISDINVSVEELKKMQRDDKTLHLLWQKVETGERKTDDDGVITFEVKRGLLHRSRQGHGGISNSQLVVPEQLRETVLRLGHDCIMSGHLGIKKTYDRVLSHFFWPGLHGDVSRYCKSCDVCQRTVSKGKVAKLPLGNMPLIETPFQRVAVDLVGPIAPCTERGHRYILTLVDYATRYPEATVLKNIEAETVAEALVTMFTRIGVPEEILSDQGSQFMSSVMKETSRLLSVTQLVTTPYHPMCNGLVEKFNGTLKAMLRRMCAERPKDWDRYVPALLFAYREAPQESLGFAPFELLYGRTVRGPMAILKDIWSKTEVEPEVKTTYQYVLDLQTRLQETCAVAREALVKAQITQKRHFDVKARNREFQAGDKVLLLLSTDNNKLLSQWKGPFEVIERMRGHNYRIKLPGKVRLFHANMMKRYYERESEEAKETEVLGAAVIEWEEDDEHSIVDIVTEQHETFREVQVNTELDTEQQAEARELIAEFSDIFTDVPKVTNLGEHTIKLTSMEPIRSRPYPLPYSLREIVDKEVETMLQMGVIEPSTAAYASPIVMVRKPDGSNRVCVDYRRLNKVTVFDPEPMPQAEEIFAELAGSNFLSKFDFTKGYWQVPMRPEDRDVTTFVTHQGLFRFKVMPFGLVNAPATFSRIMRKLLHQLKQLKNYLDDVLAHTKEWAQHVAALRAFFERVREANLALRPTKCFVGFFSITFLGHKVGSHGLGPTSDKLEKIERAPAPQTKKQLRSFLGLVGYYRSFVPNFGAIAVPLTDLTKKNTPNQLPWGDAQQKAFECLKRHVCNPPILHLPDLHRPFVLQTDASCDGIGAILLQEDNGVKHPIAFASKKLLPRERNYSTIEREALAIVWGVEKFEKFLYGQHFWLETDHQPLQYIMNAKFHNGRLMRWALALQPYRFTIRAIKGSQNVGADFLSRHAC